MKSGSSSIVRRWALGCVSAGVLIAVAACDQPRAPQPLPPPPPPEQVQPDWEPEPEPDASPAYENEKPPEETDEAEPPFEEPQFEDEPPAEPEPPVAMEPIPNPPEADAYGRPWRGRARAETTRPSVREEPREPTAPTVGKPPEPAPEEPADAADARRTELAPGTMAPIPNPPERGRVVRRDEGLLGAPAPRPAAPAARVPAPAAPPPPAAANGPSARTTIAPAAPPRPGASAASGASGSRSGVGAPVADAASPAAATPAEDPARRVAERVRREARLEQPRRWTRGQTQEVRLRLPPSIARELADMAEGATGGLSEITATLSGDGFRIEPAGPQSISADAADQGFIWRVTPQRADPGGLSARVEASVPQSGGRRIIPLGEVGPGARGGGIDLSPTTLAWILIIALVGGLILWLASRGPRNGESARDRRTRQARNSQNRQARPAAFDFRPESETGDGPRPEPDRPAS